jgi:hypothetical protein
MPNVQIAASGAALGEPSKRGAANHAVCHATYGFKFSNSEVRRCRIEPSITRGQFQQLFLASRDLPKRAAERLARLVRILSSPVSTQHFGLPQHKLRGAGLLSRGYPYLRRIRLMTTRIWARTLLRPHLAHAWACREDLDQVSLRSDHLLGRRPGELGFVDGDPFFVRVEAQISRIVAYLNTAA